MEKITHDLVDVVIEHQGGCRHVVREDVRGGYYLWNIFDGSDHLHESGVYWLKHSRYAMVFSSNQEARGFLLSHPDKFALK